MPPLLGAHCLEEAAREDRSPLIVQISGDDTFEIDSYHGSYRFALSCNIVLICQSLQRYFVSDRRNHLAPANPPILHALQRPYLQFQASLAGG